MLSYSVLFINKCLCRAEILPVILTNSPKTKTGQKYKTDWDTSTSTKASNCDGVVLEIYLDP